MKRLPSAQLLACDFKRGRIRGLRALLQGWVAAILHTLTKQYSTAIESGDYLA